MAKSELSYNQKKCRGCKAILCVYCGEHVSKENKIVKAFAYDTSDGDLVFCDRECGEAHLVYWDDMLDFYLDKLGLEALEDVDL